LRKISFYSLIIILTTFISCFEVKDVISNSKPLTHELWDTLVHKNVDSLGFVNYKGFIQDSNLLNTYLRLLSSSHPDKNKWSENQQKAYWINTYNAYTVKLITNHYPVESIKDIKKGIPFVNTVWDIKFIIIQGKKYDLNNIEHGILRPKFKDPRIHFSINCASYSCPNLRNEAYTAENLENQLNEQVALFLNDTSKNIINIENAKLSKIFSWFAGDFGSKKDKINFINKYSKDKISNQSKIDFLEYNWKLNDQKQNY
jgi:Protein of unknown function, DUF547